MKSAIGFLAFGILFASAVGLAFASGWFLVASWLGLGVFLALGSYAVTD